MINYLVCVMINYAGSIFLICLVSVEKHHIALTVEATQNTKAPAPQFNYFLELPLISHQV